MKKSLTLCEALELLHARTLALEEVSRQTPPPYSSSEGKLARAALALGPDSAALACLVRREPRKPAGLFDTDKPLVPHLWLWQRAWTCLSQWKRWRQVKALDHAAVVLWRLGEDQPFELLDQLTRRLWTHLYRKHLPQPELAGLDNLDS